MPAYTRAKPLNGASTMVLPLRGCTSFRHRSSGPLVLAQNLEIVGSKKFRVRIEGPQHSGNGAFVDALSGFTGSAKLSLHQRIDLVKVLKLARMLSSSVAAEATSTRGP